MILGRGLNVGCSHPWGVQIRSSCGLYYVRRPSIPSPSDLIHNICEAFQSSWENQGKYARAFLQPQNHAYTDRVTGRPRRRRLYRKEQGPGERIFGSQEMPAGLTTHPLTRLSSLRPPTLFADKELLCWSIFTPGSFKFIPFRLLLSLRC